MKKYIVLALMPIVLQGSLHGDDSQFKELDVLIVNELMAAQKQMNSTTRLELKAILDALVSFAGKGRNNRQVAINNIFLIQKSVNQCKDDQYVKEARTFFGWITNWQPKLVTNEIDPALNLIKADLAKLNVTQNEKAISNAALAGIAVGTVAVAAIVGTAFYVSKPKSDSVVSEEDIYKARNVYVAAKEAFEQKQDDRQKAKAYLSSADNYLTLGLKFLGAAKEQGIVSAALNEYDEIFQCKNNNPLYDLAISVAGKD